MTSALAKLLQHKNGFIRILCRQRSTYLARIWPSVTRPLNGWFYLRSKLLRYTPVRHSRKEKTASPILIFLQRWTINVLQFAQGPVLQSATLFSFLFLLCWQPLLSFSPFKSTFSTTKCTLSRIPIMKPPRVSHTLTVPKGPFCMNRSVANEELGRKAPSKLELLYFYLGIRNLPVSQWVVFIPEETSAPSRLPVLA